MTDLRAALSDYVALRRSLGFKLQWAEERLSNFLDYMQEAGSPFITAALAVRWAMSPKDPSPNWQAHRLSMVRGFARYVHTLDPRTEVPPPDLLPQETKRRPVFLYSEEDIRALLKAAQGLAQPFKARTYATLLALLAATGMRVGEAIALDRGDVDFTEAILTIRDSKFGKSREVAIHPTVVTALKRYAAERDRTFPPSPCGAFFVSLANMRLIYQNVHVVFFKLVDCAGLAGRKPRRPRIHDLRHSFASATLRDWYRKGVDVERRLPLLSTYLGHVSPATTYWYLTADPEHLTLAAKRLEERMGDLS